MASDLPDVSLEMPAVLLVPDCECWGALEQSSLDLGQSFDVKGSQGFTLCARVRANGTARTVLQKGSPPNGWAFIAPSPQGKVAFESGMREDQETLEAMEKEPVDLEPAALERNASKDQKRNASKKAKCSSTSS
jgi:hypothetical protein